MGKTFQDISFPSTLEYRSDGEHIPLEFYISAFPKAKKIDMHLGFFSSNAIIALNSVFARFIYNKGNLRLIINNILSPKDKDILINSSFIRNETYIQKLIFNLTELKNEFAGGQYFYDCLKYLIKHQRMGILPVLTKNKSLSHYKNILFYDNYNNILYTEGSANFTASGILTNGESFNVSRSWGSIPEKERIIAAQKRFEKIFSKNHKKYIYLKPDDIINAINKIGKDKNASELLEEGYEILKQELPNKVNSLIIDAEKDFYTFVNKIKKSPRFPFQSGPRKYQKQAYQNWIKNDYKGIFAMATGTGKTLTSLYCLIEEYKKTNIQKNIIVVPSEELIRQWNEEMKECNFSNIFLWYSKNTKLNKDINNIKILKDSDSAPVNVIITYSSFKSDKFLKIFKDNFDKYTLIFDEVHNMGAAGVRAKLKNLNFNRLIGLSATPLRLWDDEGENDFIESLFNSFYPDYTFSFSMKDAIGQFLVRYNYYPYFTYLTDSEWEEYLYLTSKIPIPQNNKETINSKAALKRQLLLDQAINKEKVLLDILNDLIVNNNFKWTLVYCPKGTDDNEKRIIHKYGHSASKMFPELNIQFFIGETKDRDLLLKDFEDKNVDILFAIKVLDEGVNVPMAKNAVFLASGKNYREYVQRRGRILRKYKSGNYIKEFANIYDVVVLPTINQYFSNVKTAQKLIVAEFRRLFEFYNMSIFNDKTFWHIENELKKYGLTQYFILNKIENE